MSKKYKPKHSRFTEASKEKLGISNNIPPVPYEDDDDRDDEDFGIPVSAGGSVLVPTPNPYNMLDRIREANEQLEEEKKRIDSTPRTPKVRFSEPLNVDEDHFVADELPPVTSTSGNPGTESKTSKILLVTLPTTYSIESEEILSDDDYEDDLEINNDDFRARRSFQESSIAKFSVSEEEIDDSTLPLTEETLSSSLETVLCRSETEESELSESFTKSINLNTENELINSVTLDSNKQIDYNEPLVKPDDIVEIFNKSELKQEIVSCDKIRKHLNSADISQVQKSSYTKTNKNDVSANKSSCKLKVNSHTKRNTALNLRPSTAPVKRACCKMSLWTKLPAYNGLRSEYGLSKEQLLEREKKKYELSKAMKFEKEKKYVEERQKQKENEIKFKNWLIKKKKEYEAKTIRRLQQSNYCYRTIPAPTSHLDKIGVLRRKMLKQENTCLLLDEIFRNSRPREQKTYRIYLGLCV